MQVFRVPGSSARLAELQAELSTGPAAAVVAGVTDQNVLAGLVTRWLRDQAEPLLPSAVYPQCVAAAAAATTGGAEAEVAAAAVVRGLAPGRRAVLCEVVGLLRAVAAELAVGEAAHSAERPFSLK